MLKHVCPSTFSSTQASHILVTQRQGRSMSLMLSFRCNIRTSLLFNRPHLSTQLATAPSLVRHSTVWRVVQNAIQERRASKEEEQFQAELARLASMTRYDLRNFKEAVDKPGNSWFSWVNKVPGVRSMPEVQVGERYRKILGAFTEEELAHPEKIKSREKQRVATQSGESIQEINLLLSLYENSQALHKWVRRRVADKKEMPKTQSECQVLMMGDPAGVSVGAMQQKQQKRALKKGNRLPF